MNDDWKTNIGKFFAKHGTVRLKYLNDKLYTYSKEYNKHLEEFNGIRLEEPEVYEKEYIFQLINQRLINYIECMGDLSLIN